MVLHTMLRHLRPARVIEVGSGWSSACMLDTDDLFLDGATEITFIDPEPERLESLLRGDELEPRVTIHRCRVQDVDPGLFGALEAGDVLFIDSSHVVKAGSDVIQLALDVVPTLPAGTFVHIHDIPWPFEYPKLWAEQRRWWSEAYLVRAPALRQHPSAHPLVQLLPDQGRARRSRCLLSVHWRRAVAVARGRRRRALDDRAGLHLNIAPHVDDPNRWFADLADRAARAA